MTPDRAGHPEVAPGSALTAGRRQAELDRTVGGRVDLLVVGGGVTGCGVALDAASRGLSVALVERGDLASGTSRFSSKLVHGGLRYLARGEVSLARESAVERALLMGRIAPHLTRVLPMAVPQLAGRRGDHLLTLLGQQAAQLLSAGPKQPAARLPRARRLDAGRTLRLLPGLDGAAVRGAALGHDGQLEDDARLVIALARTAAAHGARILTRVRAERVEAGGAQVTDLRTGERGWIAAGAVVSAAGVWAGELDRGVRLRPSKGSHLVLPAAALGRPSAALAVPVPGQPNRYVFALPQPDGLVLLGLTDDPVAGPVPDEPVVTPAETEFLLGTLSTVLRRPLDGADVIGSFAGLRPLVAGAAGRTADLSRRHAVTRGATGAITVVGGKLTTYRRMAQDAVDAACAQLGRARPCRTHDLPLVGATGAPAAAPGRLRRRYGAEAREVAACGAGPGRAGTAPMPGGAPEGGLLAAEFSFGVLAEGALEVDDLLARRTRLSVVPEWAHAARPLAEAALAASLR